MREARTLEKNTLPSIGLSLGLALMTLAAFWQVRLFDFVCFDDFEYVAHNPNVLQGLSLAGLSWAFTSTGVGNWHPLTWLSLMLDVTLFGPDPGRIHLVNLLLHALNVVILFHLFRRMTGTLWPSALTAALFALHPQHVESVAWIAERKDVLSTFFWLTTMVAYAWYVERRTVGRFAAALCLFALGLMAKPMLVTLPFVLLLMDYWPLNRMAPAGRDSRSLSFLIWEKLPFFALTLASSVITYLVQHTAGATRLSETLPLVYRAGNASWSYLAYIGRTLWPRDLAVLYPHAARDLPVWLGAAAGVTLLLITLLFLRMVRRRPYLTVGWLWYLGTLVPVIGLVQVGRQANADRYTYVPLIGLFMAAAWLLRETALRRPKLRPALAALSLLAVLALGWGAWNQCRVWKNSHTLFTHALAVTENNFFIHFQYGSYLDSEGDIRGALSHLNKAVRINPHHSNTQQNLGIAYIHAGDVEQALYHMREAVRIHPGNAAALSNLGLTLARLGKTSEAVKHLTEAVRLEPKSAPTHNNLGFALARHGRMKQAEDHLRTAVRLEPQYASAHGSLGVVLAIQGRFEEAEAHFQEALRIQPDDEGTRRNLERVRAEIARRRQ